ncbi:MAG: hypothetical protein IPN08_10160 [Bacteroidales bacterium]|nr:hypothetical protein [Bacteroidales bacterium]
MATPTFGVSTIRYKVMFDFVNDSLIFTDVIGANYNTVWGYTLSQIFGIVKVTDPSGTIIYQNTGWATNDLSSPDISLAAAWQFSIGNIPVDSNGVALQGTYTVEYKVNTGTVTYSVSKAVLYSFTAPTVVINMSANQSTSQLTSADVSNYTVTYEGESITPTIERSHKLVHPEGSGWVWGTPNPAQTTIESIRVIGGGGTSSTNIWTKVWTALITTTLSYTLEHWGVDPLIEVYVSVSGLDSIDVRNDTINEDLYTAYRAFIGRWTDAAGRTSGGSKANRVIETRLAPKVIELQSEYQKFLIARENGVSTDVPYARIVEILNSEGFTFNDDQQSVEIVPVSSGTGGGSGIPSTFRFTIGVTTPSGGNTGDMYIQTDALDPHEQYLLWTKQSGSWIKIGDLIGLPGDTARTAKVIYADYVQKNFTSSVSAIVFTANVDVTDCELVADDILRFKVGIVTENANPKITTIVDIQAYGGFGTQYEFTMTPNSATTYVLEYDVILTESYHKLTIKNITQERVETFHNIQIDAAILGEDTVTFQLGQYKVDTTAVSNIYVDYFIVEHIPSI